MRDDTDYTTALTFLSGEMSPREEDQYARRLAEDAEERARYQETAQVWLALGALPSETVRPHALRTVAQVSRVWLSRMAVLSLVFACGLLLGRASMSPPGAVDIGNITVTDSSNNLERSTEPLPEETRLASAWFDMQEDQPADSIHASILADLDLAELSEGSPWEDPGEWSSEQVPDWLLVALELSHTRAREDATDESPLLEPSGGESL